jgi:hypothetical protein
MKEIRIPGGASQQAKWAFMRQHSLNEAALGGTPGDSQQAEWEFMRQHSLNEAALGPSSFGLGELSTGESSLDSVSEYSTMQQMHCSIPPTIPEFQTAAAQTSAVADLELEKGNLLLSELTAMAEGRK